MTPKYKLEFMFDWGSGTCVWSANDEAKEKFGSYPIGTHDLPISDELKKILDALIDFYQLSMDFEKTNGDLLWNKEQIEDFRESTQEAYEALCEELGSEYEIELIPDDFGEAFEEKNSGSGINIFLEDDELKISGSIDLGYIGLYEGSQIEIDDTLEDIREWDIVSDNLDEDCSDEELIAFLNRYFNDFVGKISSNIENINGAFLLHVFTDMDNSEINFMIIDDLFIEEKLFYGNEEDIAEIYNPVRQGLYTMAPYLESPNDGSIPKGHILSVLKSFYPMFNFDAFLANIIPECIGLHDGEISFQCSDDFDNAILCGAYGVLDEELCINDWHNF